MENLKALFEASQDSRITSYSIHYTKLYDTPRQINILRALGAEVPQYAHLSMILGDDGTKLSKRP